MDAFRSHYGPVATLYIYVRVQAAWFPKEAAPARGRAEAEGVVYRYVPSGASAARAYNPKPQKTFRADCPNSSGRLRYWPVSTLSGLI